MIECNRFWLKFNVQFRSTCHFRIEESSGLATREKFGGVAGLIAQRCAHHR